MVGHKNAGFVDRDIEIIFHSKPGAQNIKATHEHKVENIHAFFVCLVTSQLQAEPLNRVKYE